MKALDLTLKTLAGFAAGIGFGALYAVIDYLCTGNVPPFWPFLN